MDVAIVDDARPDRLAGVTLVGGFPVTDGERYADFFEISGGEMAFPGWDPFSGADSADLDEQTKTRLGAGAIPVPEGVARGVVRLHDERRHDIPLVLVCPEFTRPVELARCLVGEEADSAS